MIEVLDTNIWIPALFFGGKPEQELLKTFEEIPIMAATEYLSAKKLL